MGWIAFIFSSVATSSEERPAAYYHVFNNIYSELMRECFFYQYKDTRLSVFALKSQHQHQNVFIYVQNIIWRSQKKSTHTQVGVKLE